MPGMASSVIGTCALCLKEDTGLCESHLLPKALYRWIQRSMKGEKNSNPVIITARQATTKSFQISEYLLCPECEDLLRLGGEEWVLKNGYRGGGGFSLQSALSKARPLAELDKASVIDGRTVPDVDVDQLVYFGISVFWRASARKWDALDHSIELSLGPYREKLRRFLLRKEAFPEQAVLMVCVSAAPTRLFGATFPYSNRVNGIWQHRFSLPGMAFWLHLGRFKDPLPALCAAHSGVICYARSLEENYEREMIALMRTATPSAALSDGSR
jgi:hypothetical protein